MSVTALGKEDQVVMTYELPEVEGFLASEEDCPSLDDKWLTYIHVPWGIPDRALRTIPPEVKIGPSNIKGAGLGIFATTFISRDTWLGEYEGEILSVDDDSSEYAFESHRNNTFTHNIDGYNVRTSNWIRYINCASGCPDENLEIMECFGKVFLITSKDIYPGQELLYWYGHAYARDRLNMTYKACDGQ